MDYKKAALEVLQNVGGEENVISIMSCFTRVRVEVKDKDKVNDAQIKKIEGCQGLNWASNTIQIIFGGKCNDVYDELEKIVHISDSGEEEATAVVKKKKSVGAVIIDYIANQRTAKFAASFGLVSHAQLARLNKLTYTNGYYSGSGGVLTNVDGSMQISGMPVVPVDFVADDKILIVDRDYLERVEAQGLTIELFEQDSDNVQKNLITARIECLEEINLMFPSSAIFADLGNVA